MASVEKRRRNGKDLYVARWRDPEGRQRNRTFGRKIDADRFLTSLEHSVLTGSYVDPGLAQVRAAEWVAQWLSAQAHLKPSTRARYEGVVTKYVLPRWGRVSLGSVKHADVVAWVAELSATGLAAATVRYVHRVFSLALDLAVRDGRLSRNPADGVRLPKAVRAKKRFLTHAEVAALADAAGPHRLVVLVLAYCGLRWGELAALRVRRVDLMRRRLEVAEAVTEVRGRLCWGTPRSHQCRSVPIPRFLVDALAAQLAGRGADELVFTGRRGGVLRNLNFRRDVFDRAAIDAGLPGLTPHELRHTAASLAVAAGANVKAVQRMLGHASAAMTLDVYADLFDADLDAVGERLDAAAVRADAVTASDTPRPGAAVVGLHPRGCVTDVS